MTTFHLPTFPPNQSYSDKDLNQPIRSQVGRHATKQSKQRECFCCGTEHSANVLLPRHAALTPWNARGALSSTTTTANRETAIKDLSQLAPRRSLSVEAVTGLGVGEWARPIGCDVARWRESSGRSDHSLQVGRMCRRRWWRTTDHVVSSVSRKRKVVASDDSVTSAFISAK
jgi:hypothetical protein